MGKNIFKNKRKKNSGDINRDELKIFLEQMDSEIICGRIIKLRLEILLLKKKLVIVQLPVLSSVSWRAKSMPY